MIGDLENDEAESPAAAKPELTTARLRQAFDYDWETGVFRRLVRMGQRGRIGDVTGHKDTHGYVQVQIDGRQYLAHRLAWKWLFGQWPKGDLDHINNKRDDNRLANLREATDTQNRINSLRPRNNKSGFKGVSWHAKTGKWVAQLTVAKRRVHLGLFTDPAAAHEVYSAAAKQHYGEFAHTGQS